MRNNYRTLLVAVLSTWILLSASHAAAVVIDFEPSDQTVLLANQASVDVVVDPMGALVGAFDIIVSWDDSIIDLASLTVDPANDFGLSADFVDTLGTTDSINVGLVSLENPLTPFQDGIAPVVLFSLTFDTIAEGMSALTFSPGIGGQLAGGGFLGNELGALLAADVNNGSITVTGAAVPEPAILVLMLIGLAPLIGAGRRQRTK